MSKRRDPKSDTGYWFDLFKGVDYASEGYYIVRPKPNNKVWGVRRNGEGVNGFYTESDAISSAEYHAGVAKYERGEIQDDEVLLAKHDRRLNGND